tara:strand:- start:1469 stop:2788 length:1320 start_codon:yes stop_codon:yes gene_type:complete
MAVRGFDVGGMFQRSGGRIGANIGAGAAAMGEGLEGLLTGVRTGLKERGERIEQERLSEETRQVLERYTGNPTGLLAKGQELLTSSDPKMQAVGERFVTIAQSRIDQQKTADAQTLAGLQSRVTAGARAGLPRTDPKLVAVREQIERLDTTGTAFEDAYLRGRPEPQIETVSEGERVVSITRGPEGKLKSTTIVEAETAPKDFIYETRVDDEGVITVVEINPNTRTSRVVSEFETREAALKAQQRLEAKGNRLTKARMTRNTVNETIDLIENNLANVDRGFFDSVGGLSQLLRFLPGTEQMNLEDLVSSIKANVGFDQLLSIKAAGSTLGQVSNIENALLQSTIANLNTLKKPEDILNALKKIRGYYNSMITKARLVEQYGKNDIPTITWLKDTNWTDANFVDAWREDFGGEVAENPDGSYLVTMPPDEKGTKTFYHIK